MFRGGLTRQQLSGVRQDFEQLVAEIDGNHLMVSWPRTRTVCLPVVKRRPKPKVEPKETVRTSSPVGSPVSNETTRPFADADSTLTDISPVRSPMKTIAEPSDRKSPMDKDETSIWAVSVNLSSREEPLWRDKAVGTTVNQPVDHDVVASLQQKRDELLFELEWIDQALRSRLQFLQLKQDLLVNGNA